MSIDRNFLKSRHEILPSDQKERASIVPIAKSGGSSPYDSANAVTIGVAQFRSVDAKSERLFANVESNQERMVIVLWVDTFSTSHRVKPSEKIVRTADLTEWNIVSAHLKMMETIWICACTQVFPEAV